MEKLVTAAKSSTSEEVLITRVFDASPHEVFGAWTSVDSLARWYAPDDCTIEIKKFEFRNGGRFHHCIRNPHVHDCWCIGTYLEIIEPEKIVYNIAISDEEGNPVEPAAMGMDPEWPAETIVTVTFEDLNGKTKLTLKQTVSTELAKRTGAYPSWLQMLDRLEADLSRS